MSRLTDLIARAKSKDPQFGADLEREFRALSSRLSFGLNFERHRPEAVELSQRPVRRGDKVRVLPARGATANGDQRLWLVKKVIKGGNKKQAELQLLDASGEKSTLPLNDLVVVAEFRDTIYPGLVSTGKVMRGDDKPWHTVINGENYHALKALTWTHRGKVDVIYIDPPYNTGAKDWKYNNDYVEKDDWYRHSKWLAMMERRLLLAKELLNPVDSVLIVTIDEKEYLRLGLLLEQAFPECNISMVSSVINPAGAGRNSDFSRTDEYIYFVRFGEARILPEQRNEERRPVTWDTLRRSDLSSVRPTRPGQFYPIYVNLKTHRIEEIGEPLPSDIPRESCPERAGCVAVFPVRPNGTEMNWGITVGPARKRFKSGYLRVGKYTASAPQPYVISYLTAGIIEDIRMGRVEITGKAEDGSVIASYLTGRLVMPMTTWNKPSHDAQRYGTEILKQLMPDRRFPFPKALYAVEDCLRHVVAEKREATVVDFFSGSGTTLHAVMRLNKQDGGRRRSIMVTNNEVAPGDQKSLRENGNRPGDLEWERWGICEYITKPRIEAAISGRTTDGKPIKGDYQFIDEFPMADGFQENAEFFTLTYETPVAVNYQSAFSHIAPLLWMRAGSIGDRIENLPVAGWSVAYSYGLLIDLDKGTDFVKAARKTKTLRVAYIVTDDERRFQSLARRLTEGVEAIRLYESYLSNFAFANGDDA
ncbi:hypothetical protein M4951_18310 [Blastopirellula sp. J2-11]|uniref:site-specific DNA-methyltransferase n=1 Tax=Blastopirellula sp. J2-11 TaxID=2943192 RepID=UPI0021C8A83C|nr:DNA methyltransferase [Blastopirellula sp. J2-11]UUO05322.1 hypothetical protein M4951_18310 [Blastopirellula sp. J2-11]